MTLSLVEIVTIKFNTARMTGTVTNTCGTQWHVSERYSTVLQGGQVNHMSLLHHLPFRSKTAFSGGDVYPVYPPDHSDFDLTWHRGYFNYLNIALASVEVITIKFNTAGMSNTCGTQWHVSERL